MSGSRLLACAALAVICCNAYSESSAVLGESGRPNIVLFMVDDYDKPETSVYGGNVLTPNLERMAREGMTFHNAHVSSSVCTPSRYTFLTGRYAGSSTFRTYTDSFPDGMQGLPGFNVGLEEDNMNVGAILAKSGYATGFVGKYHVDIDYEGEAARSMGLHIIPKNIAYTDQLNRQYFENEKRYRELIKERGFTWAKNIYWNNLKAPFKGHNPEWTILAALEFIDEHKDKPFYLHYCTTLMHGPNKEWYRSLKDKALVTGEGIVDEPLNLMPNRTSVLRRIEEAGLTENEVGYLWMDDSLGMLLDKLDELGIADNTIVCFTSDNGGVSSGDAYATSNLPLRGGKGRQWEGGIREPFYIKVPGMRSGTTDVPANGIDWYPTLAELAGVDVPAEQEVDGVSLVPVLRGEEIAERALYWHYPHYGNQGGEPSSIIIEGDWKLIHYHEDGRDELYDLAADPSEKDDVAAQHSARAHAMRARLDTWLVETDAKFPSPDPMFDAAKRAARWENLETSGLQGLEKQHAAFLTPDFSPGADWWGSFPRD